MYKFLHRFWFLTSLTLLYILLGKIGLSFALVNQSTSAIWPPTGYTIASFLLFGYGIWPSIFLGSFFVNLTTTGFALPSLTIALGNLFEGLLATYLINRFIPAKSLFSKPKNVYLYLIFAGVIAPAASASIGVVTLIASHLAQWPDWFGIWRTWWLGNMGGAMIVGPVLYLWHSDRDLSVYRRKWPILVAFILVFLLTGYLVFTDVIKGPLLSLMFLLYLALEFKPRETATGILFLALVLTHSTLAGHGTFAETTSSINQALLQLQLFISTSAIIMLSVSAVVTERSALLALFTRRERFYQRLIEKSSDGVALLSDTTDIIYTSATMEKILGYTTEEFIGTNGLSYVHPEDVAVVTRALAKTVRMPKKEVRIEMRVKHKNRSWIWVEASVRNLLDDPTLGAVVLNYRDISERKQREAAKDDFLAITAHQLQTPISSMLLNTELLTQFKKLPQNLTNLLHSVHQNNLKLSEMLNELVDSTRLAHGIPKSNTVPTDAIPIIAREVTAVQALAKKKSIVLTSLLPAAPIPPVLADPKGLSHVLQNILSNALKYTPQNGSISVQARDNGKELIVNIADTGIGIPKKDQPRLFSKFYRASNAESQAIHGTGLGLYVAKAYVSQWKGSLRFTSPTQRNGTGTTVRLQLPFASSLKMQPKTTIPQGKYASADR